MVMYGNLKKIFKGNAFRKQHFYIHLIIHNLAIYIMTRNHKTKLEMHVYSLILQPDPEHNIISSLESLSISYFA